MKIKNININGGNVNFYDNLKIVKEKNTEESDIIEYLLKLNAEQLKELEEIKMEIDRKSKTPAITAKLEKFIEQHLLPIGYSMSAAALFELLFKM